MIVEVAVGARGKGGREEAECSSNSVAPSAPMHVLLHSHVLVLHKPWCFVLLCCPLQVPRWVLQGPAAAPTEQDMPGQLWEQAEALLVQAGRMDGQQGSGCSPIQ